MVPEMEKRGYDRAFGCALTSAASTLANLIPPSLGLIIYAALASVSVGALFVATIVPGLIVAAVLALAPRVRPSMLCLLHSSHWLRRCRAAVVMVG